jgi:penicillin amidase
MPMEASERDALDVTLQGRDGRVVVSRDARGVPHVFATSNRDAAFGQGWATARDRLWQMDFQTRAAAGRLAEVLGPELVEHDIKKRRRGMVWAAERALAHALKAPESRDALEAYSQGVNAWTSALAPHSIPVEYKIIGGVPDTWTPLHSLLFAKEMAEELSGGSDDIRMTNARRAWGDDLVALLFPDAAGAREPIVSRDHVWPLPSAHPTVASEAPTQMLPPSAPLDTSRLGRDPEPSNGSNNWIVAGSRTASGMPLLADDPHLGLRVPSIWYEIRMQAPGLDVYGVSLPGLPNVIIGFNRDVAWGVTNGGNDVLDWYRVTFRDSSRREYAHEGGWRSVDRRREIVKVRGAPDVVEEVLYTHHGPVALEVPLGDGPESWSLAMRWAAHDPSDEVLAFHELNRSPDAASARAALSRFGSPVQNFVVATRQGSVALHHAGRVPLKWRGQGLFVLDGARADHDWQGWIPFDELPREEDPRRGFVSSANQHPVDGSYPYFVHGVFNATSWARAVRINELLARSEGHTPEQAMAMQTDDLDLLAQRVLPRLLGFLDARALPNEAAPLLSDLAAWDFRHTAQSRGSLFYERWLEAVRQATWGARVQKEQALAPYVDVFAEGLMSNSAPAWFDDPSTAARETPLLLTRSAFLSTWRDMSARLGPFGPSWERGRARGTDVSHLARLPGFGFTGLPTGGAKTTINALQKRHGPSWRMIATFDAEGPRAWGAYPGGPSGEPGSRMYAPFLEGWKRDAYEVLLFPRNAAGVRATRGVARTEAPLPGADARVPLLSERHLDALARLPWWTAAAAAGFVGLVSPGGLALAGMSGALVATAAWGLPMADRLMHAPTDLLVRVGGLMGVSFDAVSSMVPFLLAFLACALPAALLAVAFRAARLATRHACTATTTSHSATAATFPALAADGASGTSASGNGDETTPSVPTTESHSP